MPMLFHENSEEAEVREPGGLGSAEGVKGGAALGCGGRERFECLGEERVFQSADMVILHGTAAEGLEVITSEDLLGIRRQKVGQARGAEVERERFQRHGADGIVGTVIAADGIDGEELHESETRSGGPIDQLADGGGIANAQIIWGAEGKDGAEDTCGFGAGWWWHG